MSKVRAPGGRKGKREKVKSVMSGIVKKKKIVLCHNCRSAAVRKGSNLCLECEKIFARNRVATFDHRPPA